MLTEPTLNKLRALRLDAFAAAWAEQHKTPSWRSWPSMNASAC